MTGTPAYGLWSLVLFNSAVFLMFALSFTEVKTARDWRTFGAFAAFIVALFAEMYGFPLTIYLLSGWLARTYPAFDPASHDAGHLWNTVFGWSGNAHLNALHLLSNVLIFAGFLLLATAWHVLYQAQRAGQLAARGPYAYVRHPQYVAFVLIMLGFLLQWPTLPTVVMFPALVAMYVRLSRREDMEAHATFGEEWERYAARVPRFFPAWTNG